MARRLVSSRALACALLLLCSPLRAQEGPEDESAEQAAAEGGGGAQERLRQSVRSRRDSTEAKAEVVTRSIESARAAPEKEKTPKAAPAEEPAAADSPEAATGADDKFQTLALTKGADGDKAVSSEATPLPQGEGASAGMGEQFTPDLSSGAGRLSINLTVPPGRNGAQPTLQLAYSSTAGNSFVGFGWSLSLASIARQTDRGTPAYKRASNGLYHAEEDRFAIDGSELIPVDSSLVAQVEGSGLSVPAELAGYQEYRPRLAGSAARFFRSPDELRWVSLSESGQRSEYGLIPDGQGPAQVGTWSQDALLRDPRRPERVFRWQLTRVSDAYGSTIYFRYRQDQGEAYPLEIYYLSPAQCAASQPVRNCTAPLDAYGARVAFDYAARDDIFTSYTSGWRIATALRLVRVTMTAAQGAVGARYLVRRYHLEYESGSYHSLLSSVQREGRPEAYDPSVGAMLGNRLVAESALEPAIIGAVLPAARFEYTKPPGTGPQVAGFGGVDTTLRSAVVPASIPSVGNALAEFVDVNADGLPDLLVTNPAQYRTAEGAPAVGVYFNGFAGDGASPAQAGSFSAAVSVGIDPRYADVMSFDNANIAPMDVDGDGRTDLLHMPRRFEYGYFTPTRGADGPVAPVSPAAQDWRFTYANVRLDRATADPRIDLGSDAGITRAVDVNGDHLVDIVQTAGQSMFTWLNLGWLPGGDGRFGSATFANGAWALSTAPIESCLLRWNNQPIDFGSREVRIADMNGDGLSDIALVRDNRVVYWPGRGPGTWGDGSARCVRGEASPQPIVMADPPRAVFEQSLLELQDVNMDGAADFLKVDYDNVEIWFNRGGNGFSPSLTVRNTPRAPSFAGNVRVLDLNGSATTDVVWARGGSYQYLDLMGGLRPRMLARVDNGRGGLTTFSYASSTEDYLRDLHEAEACADSACERFTWSEVGSACDQALQERSGECVHRSGATPLVSTVVRSFTSSDQFDLLGLARNDITTNYSYHNGYYEGFEQEFRGFGATDTTQLGDPTEPTQIVRSWSHQGRRPSAIASDRLAENPYEGLKGTGYLTEIFDLAGRYLSSQHTSYSVRYLYSGLDGRRVVFVYPYQGDDLLYDTAPFAPSGESLALPSVRFESAVSAGAQPDAADPAHTVRIRAARYARLQRTIDAVDNAGHILDQTNYGRVRDESGASVSEAIATHTRFELVNAELGLYRPTLSWITGHGVSLGADGYERLKDTVSRYNASGDLIYSSVAAVVGQTRTFRTDGRAEGFTQANQQLVSSQARDGWGSVVATCRGGDLASSSSSQCLRYQETTYDLAYAQLPTATRTAVARAGGVLRFLTTTQTFDRGLGAPLTATDANAQVASSDFDGLGRPAFIRLPPADASCASSQLPNKRFAYTVAAHGAPITTTYVYTHTACTFLTDSANTQEARVYADGLGRERASLAYADAASWVKTGSVVYNARGHAHSAFQPAFLQVVQPSDGEVVGLPDVPYTRVVRDAFGRVRSQFDEDGNETRHDYYALSTDVSDPLDLGSEPVFAGTPVTERFDGHGRTISSVQRNRSPDRPGTEFYQLFSEYRADGALVRTTRSKTSSADANAVREAQVARTFTYDSLGRRIATNDPDTNAPNGSTWIYLYNRVGDLTAVRDPRGCGQNFYTDFGGRPVGEDYVSCTEATPRADIPGETVSGDAIALEPSAGRTLDVVRYYDTVPGWASGSVAVTNGQGQLTGVSDRAQRSVTSYTARGQVAQIARILAIIPSASVATATLASPPQPAVESAAPAVARRFDTEGGLNLRSVQYDHAGRAYQLSLPRAPDWNGSGTLGPTVTGKMYFNARGLPRKTELRVDGVAHTVVENIVYSASGQQREVTYGDNQGGRAPTVTAFEYDSRLLPYSAQTTRTPTETDPLGTDPLGAVAYPFVQAYLWDEASNLRELVDLRSPGEWPAGHRAPRIQLTHDALYHVINAHFSYLAMGWFNWTNQDPASDWRAELTRVNTDGRTHADADPMRPRPAASVTALPAHRVVDLSWDWDWLANMTEWTDDASVFYERSIGRITNGNVSAGRPSALYLASDLPTTAPGAANPSNVVGGWVELDYGVSGNLNALTVHGQCHDVSTTIACYDAAASTVAARRSALRSACRCDNEQHYQYRWDEANRLTDARRYDRSGGTGNYQLAARFRYLYDATNQRMVKHVVGFQGTPDRFALEVYPGDFERRGAALGVNGYEHDDLLGTEDQYLVSGARVVWERASSYAGTTSVDRDARITVGLTDLLNTTSATLDLVSGELLEYSSYYPNGARESYRTQSKTSLAPEPLGFTGKEADEEVGLTYFGERYLVPQIGRWASPDPLATHAGQGGEGLNSYHYVSGNLLQARDPLGLFGAAAPAIVGMKIGVLGGPWGMAAGFAIGTVVGIWAGYELGNAIKDLRSTKDTPTKYLDKPPAPTVPQAAKDDSPKTNPSPQPRTSTRDPMPVDATNDRKPRTLTFYHATKGAGSADNIIENGINLNKGRPETDFGQGFYLTKDENQALLWARKNRGDIVKFTIEAERYEMLTKLELGEEDALSEAVLNRQGQQANYGVDVVEGPMLANPVEAVDGTEPPRARGEQQVLKTSRAARTFNTSQKELIPVTSGSGKGGR